MNTYCRRRLAAPGSFFLFPGPEAGFRIRLLPHYPVVRIAVPVTINTEYISPWISVNDSAVRSLQMCCFCSGFRSSLIVSFPFGRVNANFFLSAKRGCGSYPEKPGLLCLGTNIELRTDFSGSQISRKEGSSVVRSFRLLELLTVFCFFLPVCAVIFA